MKKPTLVASMLIVILYCSIINQASAQRDNDDDFDDSGFDDSGYSNSPGQSRDAEESNQNPSNYSPADSEDLDDDDDVDETQMNTQVSKQPDGRYYYDGIGAQRFYSPANSVLVANVNPSDVDNYNGHQARYRRSIDVEEEEDVEQDPSLRTKLLSRRKRYAKSKYIGPVYTFVKTDKHAHYKWGVKHKVGKHYG